MRVVAEPRPNGRFLSQSHAWREFGVAFQVATENPRALQSTEHSVSTRCALEMSAPLVVRVGVLITAVGSCVPKTQQVRR